MKQKCELYICEECDVMKNISAGKPVIVKSETRTDEYLCPECWEKEFLPED